MDIKIIKSRRKTVSLCVRNGEVIIRAPLNFNNEAANSIVEKHRAWIEKKLNSQAEINMIEDSLTDKEIASIKKSAREYFHNKTLYYSSIMGIKCGRVTITSAKTRFGSCSSSGNISFSYRLMLYPEAAREYVVVHELAHILQMNHSPAFYAIVESVMPDYKIRKNLLKLPPQK